MDTTYIETDRLILRSWKMSDRGVFAEMNSNDNVMKYFPKPLSDEESNGFVDSFQQYNAVEEVTADVATAVLQEVLVYPEQRLEIKWCYQEDFERPMPK